jgi:carotenoid 1,2-hydratase
MQISTDIQKLKPNVNPPEGAYEWWYFDGLSDDEIYGFVIILYINNPFSPKYIKELYNKDVRTSKHPAVSISLYKQQKTVYYSFLEFGEDDFSWDSEEWQLSIGNHKLHYSFSEGELGMRLELQQELASGHKLKGELTGKAVIPAEDLISKGKGERHFWNLLMPSVSLDVNFRVNDGSSEDVIKGQFRGYHDHNYGAEPMKESFRDWYWGRYQFKDYTLIYYLMNKHQNQQFDAWLIDKSSQRVLCSFNEVSLGYEQSTLFGLSSARKIELSNEDTQATIQLSKVVDNGPFYQRFIGEGIVKYKGEVQAAHGISEYIYPENIYKKVYWPLVHMRLRYMKEGPHWVQKSNLLYPKTW